MSGVAKANRARGVYDNIFTDEVRQKIKDAVRKRVDDGFYQTDEWRAIISEAQKRAYAKSGGRSDAWRERQSSRIFAAHANGVYAAPEVVRKQKEGAARAQADQTLRARHAENTARLWESGTFDGVFRSPTSTEVAVRDALDHMEISHVSQYRPEGTRIIFDELISPDCLIEVNGTYWHADPRVYSSGSLNHIQQNAKRRDSRKAAWAETHDYRLIVIWEDDIDRLGAEAVIREALSDVEEQGECLIIPG